ncbi:MAG: hypothetical protein H3C62_03280 [Gemmatimonadaceae bacterium]|nr:hypothetical protein [Gemmatimonadaceae bacterium]
MPNAKGSAAKGGAALAVKDVPSLQCAADNLFRSASECCRQQARIGRVLDQRCGDEELEAVIEVSVLCVRILNESAERYNAVGSGSRDGLDEATWHAANTLWHASREYARRHHACNVKSAKMSRHSAANLGELAIEYELKASAVLALRYAVEQYQKVRPEAV